MGVWIPQSLRGEQLDVEEEIRAAFKGVTREGGVSWTEASAIDDGRSDEACADARAYDTEQRWEELIEDRRIAPGFPGEWSFLDAIGFRYYLAPAMVAAVREGTHHEFLEYALEHRVSDEEFRTLLTSAQHSAVCRFLRFLASLEQANSGEVNDETSTLVQKWAC